MPALWLRTPSPNAVASPGDESRMSWAVTTRSATPPPARSICTNAAPSARATSSFNWSGTVPRTSYALTMALKSDIGLSQDQPHQYREPTEAASRPCRELRSLDEARGSVGGGDRHPRVVGRVQQRHA